VVDNGSSDGTSEMICERFPGLSSCAKSGTRGLPGQTTRDPRGTRAFVLLLGSDAVVSDDTIRVLSGFLEDHPDVTAAACRLVNPDGTPQMSCRRFPRLRDAVATTYPVRAPHATR
jgi:GT2 family glycosyltransferase